MLKKIITTMLIVSILPINVFAASPQTKQMIHDTLSKFCISPKKENCNPREEGKYDPNYDFCLCEDDGMVYSKSGRKCVECGKGTYYKRNMKDNSCKSCSPGTYQDKEGQSSCKDCEAGKYQPHGGQSKCETCSAGSYSTGGASSCTSCEAGKYQDETGKGECINCPSGTFQDAKGQKGCKKCPKGHFSVLKDKDCYFSFIHFGFVCKPKEASLIKGNTSCTECSPGSFQDEKGQSSCKDCPDGQFQPDSGKSKCETCDANACYKVTNNRTKCEYNCTTPNLTACSRGTCVQCTSDDHCNGSDVCRNNSCIDICDVYDCSSSEEDDNNGGGSSIGGNDYCSEHPESKACLISCCIGTLGIGCYSCKKKYDKARGNN